MEWKKRHYAGIFLIGLWFTVSSGFSGGLARVAPTFVAGCVIGWIVVYFVASWLQSDGVDASDDADVAD